ncbi:MAG: DUF6438 domain-containing protein [candidate division Zixibacteria bacterium]|nr:DUF6438 domain-containing protein [candidate division Zixibacteria bacterium]
MQEIKFRYKFNKIMNRNFILVLLILEIVTIAGCMQQTAKSPITPPITPPITISSVVISKVYANEFCLGGCVNNLTITSDGTVKYYERTGDTYHVQKEGKISENQLFQLVRLFNDNDFLSLDERYDCEDAPTDAGGITFTFKDQSREKSVWVYGGCELPSELQPIDEELTEIINSLR